MQKQEDKIKKVKAVMFIPYTAHSELARRIHMKEELNTRMMYQLVKHPATC